MKRAAQLRADAQAAMAQLDADRRWKKAISTGIRRQIRDWKPGEQVFYWRKQKAGQVFRGRRARIFAIWHGPAVVLGKQIPNGMVTNQSYWIAHRGSLLLVAEQHIRSATGEESLADAVLTRVIR